MSGRDETFVPPVTPGSRVAAPDPPTVAPPSFGQSTAPPPPVSDTEEIMTAPPPQPPARTDVPTTDAEKTVTTFPGPDTGPTGVPFSQAAPDGGDISDAERTMTVPPPVPQAAETAPLIPDAILPPPTRVDLHRLPFEPVNGDPRSFGPPGASGMGGLPPTGFPPAAPGGSRTGPSRRTLIIAAGVVGVLLLGIGTAFGASALERGRRPPARVRSRDARRHRPRSNPRPSRTSTSRRHPRPRSTSGMRRPILARWTSARSSPTRRSRWRATRSIS